MNDTFIVVTWPEVQELFELEGWQENSLLISDMPIYSQYGSSSYMVRESWLRTHSNNYEELIDPIIDGLVLHFERQAQEAWETQRRLYNKYIKIPRWIRWIFKAN